MIKYLLILFLFAGCMTSKKADRQLSKIGKRFPEKLASVARDSFPLVVTKIDTTYIASKDTVIWVECPDSSTVTIDTITMKPVFGKKKIAVAITLPITTYYITNSVEDSGKLKLMQLDLNRTKEQLTKTSIKLTRRTNTMWWFAAVAVTLTAIIGISWYLKLRKKWLILK